MPHKVIMKLHSVEPLDVQVALQLYVVPYIRSEFDFCVGTCFSAIIVLFCYSSALAFGMG